MGGDLLDEAAAVKSRRVERGVKLGRDRVNELVHRPVPQRKRRPGGGERRQLLRYWIDVGLVGNHERAVLIQRVELVPGTVRHDEAAKQMPLVRPLAPVDRVSGASRRSARPRPLRAARRVLIRPTGAYSFRACARSAGAAEEVAVAASAGQALTPVRMASADATAPTRPSARLDLYCPTVKNNRGITHSLQKTDSDVSSSRLGDVQRGASPPSEFSPERWARRSRARRKMRLRPRTSRDGLTRARGRTAPRSLARPF